MRRRPGGGLERRAGGLGRLALRLVVPVALVALWWATSWNSSTFDDPPPARVAPARVPA
ncbi:MAG TPA: hypothetical protein VIL48_17020 [Acidimicrobiales bacterium]